MEEKDADAENAITDKELLQKFYDEFVWDVTDLGPNVNSHVTLDKSGQSCPLLMLRMSRLQDESATVPVCSASEPAKTTRRRTHPVPYPRKSTLTAKEVKKFLRWEEQFKNVAGVEEVRPALRATYTEFRAMQNTILVEQEDYQEYLAQAALQRIKDYNYIDPHGKEWVKEKMHARSLALRRYSRYFVFHTTFGINVVPFVNDMMPTQVENMHHFHGHVKNMNPSKAPGELPPDFIDTTKTNRKGEKPVVSEDQNAELLAVAWGADAVISMASLHTLADNNGKYEKSWEVPVIVKTHDFDGNIRKIAFIDKPLPPKILMPREKNLLYFKKLIKATMIARSFSQTKFPPSSHSSTEKAPDEKRALSQQKPHIQQPISAPATKDDRAVKDKKGNSDEFCRSASDLNENLLKNERNGSDKISAPSFKVIAATDNNQTSDEFSSSASDVNEGRHIDRQEHDFKRQLNVITDSVNQNNNAQTKKSTDEGRIHDASSEDDTSLVMDIAYDSDLPQVDGASDGKTKNKRKSRAASTSKIGKKEPGKSAPSRKRASSHEILDSDSDDEGRLAIDEQDDNCTDESSMPGLLGGASLENQAPFDKVSPKPAGFLELPESAKIQMTGFDTWKSSFTSLTTTPLSANRVVKIDSPGLFGTSKTFQPYTKETTKITQRSDSDQGKEQVTASTKKKPTASSPFELSFGAAALPLGQEEHKSVPKKEKHTNKKETSKKTTNPKVIEKFEVQNVPVRRSQRNKNKKSSEEASSEDSHEIAPGLDQLPKPKRKRKLDSVSLLTEAATSTPARRSARKKRAATLKISVPLIKTENSSGSDVTKKNITTESDLAKKVKDSGKSQPGALTKESVAVHKVDDSKAVGSPRHFFSCIVKVPTTPQRNMAMPKPADKPVSSLYGVLGQILDSAGHTPVAQKSTPVLITPAKTTVERSHPAPHEPVYSDSDILGQIMGSSAETPHTKKPVQDLPPPIKTGIRQSNPIPPSSPRAATVDMLEPPHGSENMGYALWRFRNRKVLIRYSVHGILPSPEKNCLQTCNVSFQTKLEYQNDFVYEQITPSELCHNWVTTHFKPAGTRIVRSRVDPITRKLLDVEWPTIQELHEKASLLGFSAMVTAKRLSVIFEKLTDLAPSTYILGHEKGKSVVTLQQSVKDPSKKVVNDLYEEYKCPGRDVPYNTWVPWVPADPKKLSKYQMQSERIPLTFIPRSKIVDLTGKPKKRSKGKKKNKNKKKEERKDQETNESGQNNAGGKKREESSE